MKILITGGKGMLGRTLCRELGDAHELVVADVPFIMGYNIFIAVLTIIGTLLSDLMYAVVDPRVKLGR